MDKAYWGTMRWGHFRWGVYDPEFDRVLNAKKKLAAKTLQGFSPAVAGLIVAARVVDGVEVGGWRAGVIRAEFDEVLARFKKG